jgi:hypothetical protein
VTVAVSKFESIDILINATGIPDVEPIYFEIAKKNGLRYVCSGNVPGRIYNLTYCPFCNREVIYRIHFDILEINVVENASFAILFYSGNGVRNLLPLTLNRI